MTIKLLTYAETSKLTGIKLNTLYVLVMQERIPYIKLGIRFIRFSEDDLKKWIETKKCGGRNE